MNEAITISVAAVVHAGQVKQVRGQAQTLSLFSEDAGLLNKLCETSVSIRVLLTSKGMLKYHLPLVSYFNIGEMTQTHTHTQ